MRTKSASGLVILALLWFTLPCFAASPWVLEDGQSSYSLTYVTESFEDKWLGTVKSPIAEISQQTYWLTLARGISERWQVELTLGDTSSDKADVATNFHGLADSRLSAKFAWSNEYSGDPVSSAIVLSAIIKGTYDRSSPGLPHSPGDKANGLEVAIPFSRSLGWASIFGDLGYRMRRDDVPDDLFYSIGLNKGFSDTVYLSARYIVEDGRSGLDIAGPGFNGNLFHETEEDRDLYELSLSWSLANGWSIYAGLAEVLDGKNTGDSSIQYFGVSWQ